jgi:hypothetical protein
MILVPVSIAFGLTPIVLAAYQMVEAMAEVFSHANIELPRALDRTLRWVIITPNMHSIHHSSHQPETDSNYGQLFSIWDRLFRTYTAEPKKDRRDRELGLKEVRDGRTASYWWQLKSPLLHFPTGRQRLERSPLNDGCHGRHADAVGFASSFESAANTQDGRSGALSFFRATHRSSHSSLDRPI